MREWAEFLGELCRWAELGRWRAYRRPQGARTLDAGVSRWLNRPWAAYSSEHHVAIRHADPVDAEAELRLF